MQTLIAAYGMAGLGTIAYALWLYIGDLRLSKRQHDLDTRCRSQPREATRKSAA